ncbi:uncharacterized protein spd-2 isoform X2 [Linepithema humile]|uniref:uncharacterized protein spd-2 isoform X2 n=1 Tax=Linepithema humile TaxID=83485 RepID=UPI00351E8791
MFTPIKPKSHGTLNDTVLNTPLPQATSTVQRKNRVENRFSDDKQSEIADKEVDFSLGILENMSDAQLESARKLLQRCSAVMSIDMNKENNVNVQNVTSNLPVSNLDLSKSNQECNIDGLMNKTNVTNISFEPNEITGRSSGISNCAEKQTGFISQSAKGFDFSTTEIMAQLNNEMMVQINNEEFLSGSKMAEQLLLDEAYWKQNCTYSMPVMTTEKQKLQLSSFSGIIGEQDLSLESCAGQRVSIGQYFGRKSNNIGVLGNDKVRPSFSFSTETPIRTGNPRPLIESTVASDATVTSTEVKEREHIPSVIRDIDKTSILSLSTIANTLEDANSGTPRRLVDQLLMAQKKKKNPVMQNNARKETYALPSDRNSVLARPTENSKKFDEDINLEISSIKLDNKTKNETIDVKQECSRTLTFASKEAESFTNACKEITLKEEESDKTDTFVSFKQNAVSSNNKLNKPYISFKMNRKSFDEESYSNLNIQRQEEVKEQEISNNLIGSSFSMSTDTKIQCDVIIGKNTEQLCNCIVGMQSEVNIELVNNGHRWITYCVKLVEIQGDMQSIELTNLQDIKDMCLLKPNETKPTKIGVKVIKMCKPIFVEFNIMLLDMVAKIQWCIKHMIFVKPEQLELDVICDSYKQELDFQYIEKNCTKVLPISLHNKNSVDIPVQLSILHDGPKIFSIDSTLDGPIKLSESHDNISYLVLKPHEKFTANIKCELQSTLTDSSQKQPQYWKSKLIVRVQCNNGIVLFQKEVSLYAQLECTEQQLDSKRENYLRCQTPNNIFTPSPATSPQSVTSTVSGPHDRNSPVSTVSSVAVAGNTIPIKATHAALAWNSIKIGKSEIKELTIRNTSDNKIKIQIDICDDSKSFKFLGDRQIVNTSMVLAMQRQEIKTLAIMFSPYRTGSVDGKIIIKHYVKDGGNSQQHKMIPLYGYGGCGKLKVSETFNDLSGRMWLKLGTLDSETTPLKANITLQNIGDLCSFAKIKIVPKGISPVIQSSWNVHPKEFILDPKQIQQVSIEYQPKKEDFMILQRSAVSHVATLNITYGDEPTRWRIRRLYEKIEKSGGLTGHENDDFKNIVQPICKIFPGEQLLSGLTRIRDSAQHLSDLCTGIQQYEITLTVETCADDSLPVHYDHDESGLYYSLISDTTQMDEAGGASFLPFQAATEYESQQVELEEEKFAIIPSIVILNPPLLNEATITVINSFKVSQPFQTSLSNMDYFSVVPMEGMLPSRKRFSLKIQCSQRIQHNTQGILEIYTENHKQDVLIEVLIKRH